MDPDAGGVTRRRVFGIASWAPARVGRRLMRLMGADLELLVGAFLVVSGVCGFLVLSEALEAGFVRWLDERIVLALRNPASLGDAIGPGHFESAMRDLTALGSYAVLTLLSACVIAFLLMRRQTHAAALVCAASAGGALLMQVLKDAFERPRPRIVPYLFGDVGSHSFPSGHALAATAVYLTLAALLARMTKDRRSKAYVVCAAFLIVFLVGFSRVYLGVHWPSDVLAGWLAGLSWAVLCWIATAQLQRRGTVERPDETAEEAATRAQTDEA